MMPDIVFVLMLVMASQALPAKDALLVDIGKDDTAVVESVVREVRAAAPAEIEDLLEADTEKAYINTYDDGDDGDNDKGYYRQSNDKGNDGYKHFDSYHKKDGDKYGYETHSAYGKYAGNKDDDGEKSGEYAEYDDGDDKVAYTNDEDDLDDEGSETKHTYKVVENVDEGEGDSNHYTAGDGESDHYSEGGDSTLYNNGYGGHYVEGGESGQYNAGYDGGNYAGGNSEHEGESGGYTHEGSDDDGESEHYTAEDEDSDY